MIARRDVLAGEGVFAAASAVPGLASAPPIFNPAPGAHRLTRRIERELGPAVQLVVERSWAIAFNPAGRGFEVAGRQLAVSVDAPPELAELAAIERARREDSAFPMMLDASGRMITRQDAPVDGNLAKAIDAVRGRLQSSLSDPTDLSAGTRFLDALQQAGQQVVSAWPADLFAPGSLERSQPREVALPDGTTGTVSVRETGLADPLTGLMQRFERQVETRIGSRTKSGRELFTLARET